MIDPFNKGHDPGKRLIRHVSWIVDEFQLTSDAIRRQDNGDNIFDY